MIRVLMLVFVFIFAAMPMTEAAEKILFLPHDNRPISSKQTAEVVTSAGYEVLMPPLEYLTGMDGDAHNDALWQWLFENAPTARAAVISSDALLYGGLIPSRKHEISQEVLSARVDNFKKVHDDNPGLNLYVFGSLMRTPFRGTRGDIEEPEYYVENGANIFQYTRFLDKQETSKLNRNEKRYLDYLEQTIPKDIFSDWMNRRNKNLSATKKLADFTKQGIISYMVIGRDDNAPLGQTHRENRALQKYFNDNDISKQQIQSLAGIDEFGILLLARAVNDISGEFPFINVAYNTGVGGNMIPAYSDEKISTSIKDAVTIIGGMLVPNPARADLVLLVNTKPDGKPIEIHNPVPAADNVPMSDKPNKATKFFANLVEKNVDAGYPVAVADIMFPNGSDNALMKILHDRNLLYKIQAYSGWNTATNSTGFVLGAGLLSKNMTADSKARLLSRRYLEDWGYQANIRTIIGRELFLQTGDPKYYYQFTDQRAMVEARETELLREFAAKELPPFSFLRDLRVVNPWNRMFECDIIFGDGQ